MGLANLLKRLLGQPDRVRAIKFLGEGVRRARDGDLDMALYFYRKAQRADEEYALTHLNLGLAQQDLYNRDLERLDSDARLVRLVGIATALDRALELDAELVPALHARGYVRRALGQLSEAAADLERYLELATDDDARRQTVVRDLDEVRTQAEQLARREELLGVVRDPAAEPSALQEVKPALAQLMALRGEEAELLWATGVTHRRLGEIEEARAAFARVIEVDPGYAEGHRELASLAFCEGSFEQALRHAREAYSLDPTSAAVVCNVGVCYLELGRLAEAEEHIELARRLDPDDPIVLDCLEELAKAQRGERPLAAATAQGGDEGAPPTDAQEPS